MISGEIQIVAVLIHDCISDLQIGLRGQLWVCIFQIQIHFLHLNSQNSDKFGACVVKQK